MGLGLGSIIGSVAGGVLGTVGGIFGGISHNKKVNGMKNDIGDMQADNQSWYDRRYNEDATQRADAQRLLNITEERIKARNKAAAGTAAVMGSSQEAVAAEKEANNKAMADAVSQIAVAGERRKDAIENQYLNRKNQLADQMMGVNAQKKNWMDITNDAMSGAAGGVMSGYDAGSLFNK